MAFCLAFSRASFKSCLKRRVRMVVFPSFTGRADIPYETVIVARVAPAGA